VKAWRFDRYGSPSVLELEDRATPQPGPGEAVVELRASGVNPSDVKNVSGHFKTPIPRVPGRDYAGVVVSDGSHKGEEVWGSGPGFGVARDGAHAQYIVVPVSWLSKKPRNLDMEQAASIGVPFLAAWWSLVEAGEIRQGETLLVTGASGGVGQAATQIAHARGARVIGADLSKENPSGAEQMIDTSHEALPEHVADIVLDTVGGSLFEPSLRTLRRGGRQIAIASNPQVVNFNLVEFYHGVKRLIGVDTMALTGEQIAATMDRLRSSFEDGSLKAPSVHTWPFEQAIKAYEAVESRNPPGKHVLVMK
jgi:NADPH:quinone reductase